MITACTVVQAVVEVTGRTKGKGRFSTHRSSPPPGGDFDRI